MQTIRRKTNRDRWLGTRMRPRIKWGLLWCGISVGLWFAGVYGPYDWLWATYLLLNFPAVLLTVPLNLLQSALVPLDPGELPTWVGSMPTFLTVAIVQSAVIEALHVMILRRSPGRK